MIENGSLNPEKDLNLGDSSLNSFIDRISPRYFQQETVLPEAVMTRTTDVLAKAGKREFGHYSMFDAVRKERKGIATIIVDCSKIVPQEAFAKLAAEGKNPEDDDIGNYELYAEMAYTIAVTLEVFDQMLALAATKPRFRPDDKQFVSSIAGLRERFAGYIRVNADVAGDTRSYICQNLEAMAKYFGLQKFVLILSNSQAIPNYAKKDLVHMFYRNHGENDTSVMFLAKERTPADVEAKIAELHQRLGKGTNSEYRGVSDDLMKALGTYQVARGLKAEIEKIQFRDQKDYDLRKEKTKKLANLMGMIQAERHNFYDLDAEFSLFTDDELKLIQQKLFVF